ncbi:hypothetical protein AUJ65_04785 [Candidatus Micrarchaeota archaeon CG1_02_51_15]|nr:MAG: hypothetical protein AUJ65_04785 [Candidatus Micrarchaeota archaeon CG1_02_51_15]
MALAPIFIVQLVTFDPASTTDAFISTYDVFLLGVALELSKIITGPAVSNLKVIFPVVLVLLLESFAHTFIV